MSDYCTTLVLLGGGAHAKSVKCIAERSGITSIRFCLPDKYEIKEKHSYIAEEDLKNCGEVALHAAMGCNNTRSLLTRKFNNYTFVNIIDPSAQILSDLNREKGIFIGVNATVMNNCSIGFGSIINTSANIDHDTRVGDFTHIAPGVTICGSVDIGSNCLIGANSTILPGIQLRDNTIIPAGATVYSNTDKGDILWR